MAGEGAGGGSLLPEPFCGSVVLARPCEQEQCWGAGGRVEVLPHEHRVSGVAHSSCAGFVEAVQGHTGLPGLSHQAN